MKEHAGQIATNPEKLAAAIDIGQSIIYLMGMSFVLGSLFTILILILLDFMKRDRVPREPD